MKNVTPLERFETLLSGTEDFVQELLNSVICSLDEKSIIIDTYIEDIKTEYWKLKTNNIDTSSIDGRYGDVLDHLEALNNCVLTGF